MGKTEGTAEPRSGDLSVCSWRYVKYIDNFLRPHIHNPEKLFAPYVGPNMTILDVGCGGGFASIGLARAAGDTSTIIAADLQPEMLEVVREKAKKAGLSGRVRTHRCLPDRIGVEGPIDFALAFFMVHEVPDIPSFLAEIYGILRPGGRFFIAEPLVHTSKNDFRQLVVRARAIGFVPLEYPKVTFGRAVVLARK
jgi:ubiquinone/menaquinone biosynthesis C-methylase UbiE